MRAIVRASSRRGRCRALEPDASGGTEAYRWPGNVRELENAIERALILAEEGLVAAAHLGLGGGTAEPRETTHDRPAAELVTPDSLADLEKRAIVAALEQTGGNKTRAAVRLGITRTKLHTRLKRFGIV